MTLVFRILGMAFLLGAAATLVLLAVTLVLMAVHRRTGRVAWPRLATFGGGLLYSPLSALLRLVGRRSTAFDLFLIDATNARLSDAFAHAGPSRMVVMPQCMRSGECKARLHPIEGYKCLRCGKCVLGDLSQSAEAIGLRFFIVPGDRYVKRLVKLFAVDAAIGVACPCELSEAMIASMRTGMAVQGVPLGYDGCFETRVDVERVKEAMRRCGTSSNE